MATTYHDPDGRVAAYVLQGRTDGSGVEAEGEHVDGQDLRLLSQFLTAGVKGAAAFQVRERQAGATMSVDVGSGTVGDVAVIAGADPLQGNYIVGWPEAVTNVTIGAADLSNPRIDEIYLVVQDHTYDHNGANIVPRLAVRDGTPSSSPTPPGPDASWKAYLLLATVDVGAGVTEIEDDDITDERVMAGLAEDVLTATFFQNFEVDGSSFRGIHTDLLGTSYNDVRTVSLTIPSHWKTWKCEAFASCEVVQTGAASSVFLRVVADGNNGDARQVTVGPDAQSSGRQWVSIGEHFTGLTNTGSRSIVFQARPEGSNLAALNGIYLYARAVRTS